MERAIETAVVVAAPFGQVRDVFLTRPSVLIDGVPTSEGMPTGCFRSLLTTPIGGRAAVQQEIIVAIGAARPARDAVVVPIRWDPAGHEHLLPSFEGTLEAVPSLQATKLTLRGAYHVPLGVLGRLADDVAGRRVGQQTLAAFAHRSADCLEREVARRAGLVRTLRRAVAGRAGTQSHVR